MAAAPPTSWTDFLSKVSADWKSKVGSNTSVNWPVGLGGKGNEGVTGLVKQTPGSIGYVELIYAIQNKYPTAMCRTPLENSSRRALQGLPRQRPGPRQRTCRMISGSPSPNPPGATAYPISSFTWLLIPDHFRCSQAGRDQGFPEVDADRRAGIQRRLCPTPRLPKPVVDKELKAISLDQVADDIRWHRCTIERAPSPRTGPRAFIAPARHRRRGRSPVTLIFAFAILLITSVLVYRALARIPLPPATQFGWQFFWTRAPGIRSSVTLERRRLFTALWSLPLVSLCHRRAAGPGGGDFSCRTRSAQHISDTICVSD